MILRRLSTAFRKQDWFTVVIETLVVVFGVFIGLQASNWNSAVQDRKREAVVLEQLAVEFTAAVETAKAAKTRSEESLRATRTVLGVIREGNKPEDSAAFLKTLGRAASFASGPSEPATLTELLSAGRLSDLSSPGLRTALTRYHETSTNQNEMALLVLSRVSSPHDGFHAAIHVNPDYPDASDILLDRYDWDLLASTRQQFQVILYGKVSLASGIEKQIVHGEAVLAEIDKARK